MFAISSANEDLLDGAHNDPLRRLEHGSDPDPLPGMRGDAPDRPLEFEPMGRAQSEDISIELRGI